MHTNERERERERERESIKVLEVLGTYGVLLTMNWTSLA